MKTKEQIKKYNKEYCARPEVIAKAKIKNALPESRAVRKKYKQSKAGKKAELRYVRTQRSRELRKISRLKRRYGITLEDYEKMFKEQKGKCAICGIKKDKLDIDHCHRTNKVRGLLCGSCNRALGLLKDNTEFLNNAIRYLLR